MREGGPCTAGRTLRRRPKLFFSPRSAATAAGREIHHPASGHTLSLEIGQVEVGPSLAARTEARELVSEPGQVRQGTETNGGSAVHGGSMPPPLVQGVTYPSKLKRRPPISTEPCTKALRRCPTRSLQPPGAPRPARAWDGRPRRRSARWPPRQYWPESPPPPETQGP